MSNVLMLLLAGLIPLVDIYLILQRVIAVIEQSSIRVYTRAREDHYDTQSRDLQTTRKPDFAEFARK